jgi:hypothetical protein
MSEMEVFYGRFKKSDHKIEPEDTDDFYELEEEHKCHFVKVRDQLYEFSAIEELEPYGFSLAIPPSDESRFICMWYNGGAGIHEVVESLIESTLP